MTTGAWPGTAFEVRVGQAVLDDLRDRLSRTRLPTEQAGADWATGTPLRYVRRLRDHWLDRFDWRAWEARINAREQRLVEIDGVTLHVVVERGSGPDPLPLVMTNGWPGSFLEFLEMIDRLAHPERSGGRAADAFTVVIPSLPGYGFSPPPAEPLSPERIALLWSALAARFGFQRYVAYGSDWGSFVTARLALAAPAGLRAVMLASPGLTPTVDDAAPLFGEEAAWRQAAGARLASETGYQRVQATKPQSLAYGQTDSPIGLAGWIVEKYRGWTLPDAAGDPPFALDDLIANVMLYWLNGCVAPMWLYACLDRLTPVPAGERVALPAGFLFSPHDLVPPPPRAWLERVFADVYVSPRTTIGHFPGQHDADLLVDELRTFMRKVR